MITRYVVFAAMMFAACGAARAAVLDAGTGQRYAQPSAAIAAAQNGDTVQIHPGQYFDCAIIRQSNITIEGTGDGAVLTDSTCGGKGILITNGNNIIIRNLTLQRARVPDQNGAGIRAQGGNLTVEDTRFINNQMGILAGGNPQAVIRVVHSSFIGNGACTGNDCAAHAIYVGPLAELDVEQTRFLGTQNGHNIQSRAAMTRVINCDIQDGPDGTSSYQISIPVGGSLIAEGNTLEKGPRAQNWSASISIGQGGVRQPTNEITISNNLLINNTGHTTIFVRNLTATPAQLSNNKFQGGPVRPLQGDGSVH